MKNLKYTLGMFLLATSITLVGCNSDLENKKIKDKQNINNNLEEYEAKDIYIIDCVNPLTLENNYYFMRLIYEKENFVSNDDKMKEIILKEIPRSEEKNINNLSVTRKFLTFDTIFQDNSHLIINDESINYTGINYEYINESTTKQLQTENYIYYTSFLNQQENNDIIKNNYKVMYSLPDDSKLYSILDSNNEIKVLTLAEFYNCSYDTIFEITTLEDLYNELNNEKELIKD